MQSVNPATGETLLEYESFDTQATADRIHKAARTFVEWRATSFALRAARLHKAADLLRHRAEEYALLMAREMGKPIFQGRKEIKKCAWVCSYYADHGARMLERRMVETDADKSYVSYQPLGVILGIMPWNFPFWQVFRFAAPTLMAGNTVLIKHAASVPGCAVALQELFSEADFPLGAFEVLLVDKDHIQPFLPHPDIAGVSLTGSVEAGREIASRTGRALKQTVLELGGSDPYVVLEDADLEKAAELCVSSRLINTGQSCIAAKRFVVAGHERARRFEDIVVERMRSARVGDPTHDETEVGPMARESLRDNLHRQVQTSVRSGAELRLGGSIPSRPGWWYPPTVLADGRSGMPAYSEELFGPVAAILRAGNETEAIRMANDTRFGLGACVLTNDLERGEHIAERSLEAGSCFVNAIVRSDARLPFGGVKDSGHGRELGSEGIREFVNVKTVYIATL